MTTPHGNEHHATLRTPRRMAARVSAVAWALQHDPLVTQRLQAEHRIDSFMQGGCGDPGCEDCKEEWGYA